VLVGENQLATSQNAAALITLFLLPGSPKSVGRGCKPFRPAHMLFPFRTVVKRFGLPDSL
jgi:hypothetical protein